MKITSEKKEVVGVLSTLVGRFSLLNLLPSPDILPSATLRNSGALAFRALNDEGFECDVWIHGDFIVIPSVVPTLVDVKRPMTKEEEENSIHFDVLSVIE